MLRIIIYILSVKVIFLINVILIIKGISNRIVGIIISINANSKVKAVFLIKNRIKVRAFNITLL